jgi:hypothetical protein
MKCRTKSLIYPMPGVIQKTKKVKAKQDVGNENKKTTEK